MFMSIFRLSSSLAKNTYHGLHANIYAQRHVIYTCYIYLLYLYILRPLYFPKRKLLHSTKIRFFCKRPSRFTASRISVQPKS